MERDRQDLDARVEQIAGRLERVERRLASLEAAVREGRPLAEQAATAASAEQVAERTPAVEALPLIGRTLVVLAGAFALRAVTESGVLPRAAGSALGIAYAVLWIVLADRAAAGGRRASAAFHGLAGAVIAFPLLWEATVKFDILSPRAAAATLSGITALGLAVAARKRLGSLAWVFALGAAATAVALAVATQLVLLFATLLLLLGLATLWLGYLRQWQPLGWTVAGLVDAFLLVLVLIALRGVEERVVELLGTHSLVALLLALAVLYLGSFIVCTWTRGLDVWFGEIAQGAAAVVVGLGGAVAVARSTGVTGMSVGAGGLVLAAACYAVSFTFIDRKLGRRGNFVFYTSVALVCTLVALAALLDGAPLSVALALAGLLTALLGSIRKRATISLHGAVYAVTAAITSGLLASSIRSLAMPGLPPLEWVTVAVLVVVVVAAVYCWLPVETHGRTWGKFSNAPKLVVLAVLALGLGGIAVTLGALALPATAEGTPERAALAVLRTGVLAVAAVLLSLAGRWRRLPEAAWLVYPVLIAGGVKLLLEDLRQGGPGTLLLSFALYGLALILAPRWVRRGR